MIILDKYSIYIHKIQYNLKNKKYNILEKNLEHLWGTSKIINKWVLKINK